MTINLKDQLTLSDKLFRNVRFIINKVRFSYQCYKNLICHKVKKSYYKSKLILVLVVCCGLPVFHFGKTLCYCSNVLSS